MKIGLDSVGMSQPSRHDGDRHCPVAGPERCCQNCSCLGKARNTLGVAGSDGDRGSGRCQDYGHCPSFITTALATSVFPVKIANTSAIAAVAALAERLTVTLGVEQFSVVVTV